MIDYDRLLDASIAAAIKAGDRTLDYYMKSIDIVTKDDNSPVTLADLESNKIINECLKPTGIPILSEENNNIPFDHRKNWKSFWLVDPLDGTREFINKSSEYSINIALIEGDSPEMGVVYIPAKGIIYYGLKELGSFKAIYTSKKTIIALRNESIRLPAENQNNEKLVVVVSKSHLSEETKIFIEKMRNVMGDFELQFLGSSLKLCMVAEGCADIYPRLGQTMEWDTAASHAIARFAGCKIINLTNSLPLVYNKENLMNPSFMVYRRKFDKVLKSIIC
jgi:3'(2'), 5'-bisphosphate nucleotidase